MLLLIILSIIIIFGIITALIFLARAVYFFSKYKYLSKKNTNIYFIEYKTRSNNQKKDDTYISLN